MEEEKHIDFDSDILFLQSQNPLPPTSLLFHITVSLWGRSIYMIQDALNSTQLNTSSQTASSKLSYFCQSFQYSQLDFKQQLPCFSSSLSAPKLNYSVQFSCTTFLFINDATVLIEASALHTYVVVSVSWLAFSLLFYHLHTIIYDFS